MGQYWKFDNIDQRCKLRHVGGLKLWEYIHSTSAEQLVGLLKNVEWVEFNIPSNQVTASKHKSSGSRLVALPQEIIDMIVSIFLDNQLDEDIVCLSLTCSYFFRLLGPFVQSALIEDSGPWSGHRLVFVGDYASGYPPDIATAEEKAEWDCLGRNPLYNLSTTAAAEGRNAMKRSFLGEVPFELWGEFLDRAKGRLCGDEDSLELFDRQVALLTQPLKEPTLAGSAPVLRNLTTKEYVRDTALAESDFAYSLGEVLITYAQWTEDGSGLEGLDFEGEWAGHRFDISDMASVAGEEWKDVSDDALEKLQMVTGYEKKDGRRA